MSKTNISPHIILNMIQDLKTRIETLEKWRLVQTEKINCVTTDERADDILNYSYEFGYTTYTEYRNQLLALSAI